MPRTHLNLVTCTRNQPLMQTSQIWTNSILFQCQEKLALKLN